MKAEGEVSAPGLISISLRDAICSQRLCAARERWTSYRNHESLFFVSLNVVGRFSCGDTEPMIDKQTVKQMPEQFFRRTTSKKVCLFCVDFNGLSVEIYNEIGESVNSIKPETRSRGWSNFAFGTLPKSAYLLICSFANFYIFDISIVNVPVLCYHNPQIFIQ